jgi:16S rRNA (cytidine1402-2'-O)-methyltransferase
MTGKLFVVPTPIGNLADMTFRAIEVLKSADLILAEDTRNSGKLLKHFEVATPMSSYHMHNEHQTVNGLIQKLQNGNTIALISDAGTPAISDPGFLLVRACVENKIPVETLPGATAFVPALVNSGFPSDRFVFEGFLPEKKGRQTRLLELAEEARTVVLYVSPHKLLKTLDEIKTYFGEERQVSCSRELSKLHEETVRGTAIELTTYFSAKAIKGEFVVCVQGKLRK